MSDKGGESGEPTWVYGNRPVQELMERRPRSIQRLLVAVEQESRFGRLLRAARQAGIPTQRVPRRVLTQQLGHGIRHQGVLAEIAPRVYADAETLCLEALEATDAPLLLAVDRVQDPGNLGSILRSAIGAGVSGVLLSSEGTVGLTPAVAKASAGAVEGLVVAREPRLARRIGWLREKGFETVVLDPRGDVEWDRVDLTGPTLILAGGERRGVRPSLADACNSRARISMAGNFDSLNVAISTGVLLFEAVRQRKSRRRGS
ncbi:MAG: RNA methyltransferase [Acidobacteriota bacterium]|nr:RNA methyltransferase [Acidobacteriota bacterium]MDH3786872.1 RNA methyltransferase [Acidobacteriota bacterium]